MTLNVEAARRGTASSAARSIEVIPTGAALGAEVRAGDLRAIDDATFATILDAWHAHSVLLFRDQALSDRDVVAFSRRFGDLDLAPRARLRFAPALRNDAVRYEPSETTY